MLRNQEIEPPRSHGSSGAFTDLSVRRARARRGSRNPGERSEADDTGAPSNAAPCLQTKTTGSSSATPVSSPWFRVYRFALLHMACQCLSVFSPFFVRSAKSNPFCGFAKILSSYKNEFSKWSHPCRLLLVCKTVSLVFIREDHVSTSIIQATCLAPSVSSAGLIHISQFGTSVFSSMLTLLGI